MSSPAAVWRPVVTEILRNASGPASQVGCADTRPEHAASARCGARIFHHASGARAIRRSAGVRERRHARSVTGADRPARRGAAIRADNRGVGPEVVTAPQILGIVTAVERRGVTVDLSTLRQRALAIFTAARSFGAAAWWYALRAWPRA
jgi:hypothetical protein